MAFVVRVIHSYYKMLKGNRSANALRDVLMVEWRKISGLIVAIFTTSWYGIVHFCPLSEAVPGGSGFWKRAGARFGHLVARIIGQNPLLDSRLWKFLKRIPRALGAFGASRHELHLSASYADRGGKT
ncbi:MAG TPA: hypothetical protein PK250_18865 [Syntrophobacter fumaroxidans]|nr:hypothetical protein [Syntrophobacter fumaroxidans]